MTNKQLEFQNQTLKSIITEIWWMARRYADGRSTYAPGLFNQVIDLALKNGVQIGDDQGKIYADDGQLGEWDPLTQGFKGER